MKRLLIYVEGQTEETFVRDVLASHLWTLGIHPEPTLARTKRTKSGRTFKGGITSYERVRNDIGRLLNDSGVIAVTTMLDYYHLPGDFPGKDRMPFGSCFDRVKHLKEEFGKDIDHAKFLPFLMLHEFEALLFSRPNEIESAFPDLRIKGKMSQETVAFTSPEEINEGENTHPAARILRHTPGYSKPVHGPLIAKRIGLPAMRERCSHFNEWLSRLEMSVYNTA